jgi:hypothetical protein
LETDPVTVRRFPWSLEEDPIAVAELPVPAAPADDEPVLPLWSLSAVPVLPYVSERVEPVLSLCWLEAVPVPALDAPVLEALL